MKRLGGRYLGIGIDRSLWVPGSGPCWLCQDGKWKIFSLPFHGFVYPIHLISLNAAASSSILNIYTSVPSKILPWSTTNNVETWLDFFHNEVVVTSHFVTAPNCPILGCIYARLRCTIDPLFGLDGCSRIACFVAKRRRGVSWFQTYLWRVSRRLFTWRVLFDWQVESFFRNTPLGQNSHVTDCTSSSFSLWTINRSSSIYAI